MTAADFRRIALSFEGAEEGSHMGAVDFRVGGHIFATLASVDQFRTSFDSALSYFVGGNPTYPEDKGFAIKPWSKVRWKNVGITNNSCTMAVAMGNYYFTPVGGGEETKVEYTFGYIRGNNGALKIVVHQSSVPYNGA